MNDYDYVQILNLLGRKRSALLAARASAQGTTTIEIIRLRFDLLETQKLIRAAKWINLKEQSASP